jgi:hypothetical protein
MNKLYIRISVIFQVVSTIFFPYYFSIPNHRYEKAFGFPYGYIVFHGMNESLINSLSINLLILFIDFIIIYICVRIVVKIYEYIKTVANNL